MRALRRKIVLVCQLNRALRYSIETFVVAGDLVCDRRILKSVCQTMRMFECVSERKRLLEACFDLSKNT
jgi:hypothetical protein